jgi:hypothetical protein
MAKRGHSEEEILRVLQEAESGASLLSTFGGLGGVVNALLNDNGFVLSRKESGVWCPGAIISSSVTLGRHQIRESIFCRDALLVTP